MENYYEDNNSLFTFSPYSNLPTALSHHEAQDKNNYLYSQYGVSKFPLMCFEPIHQKHQICPTTHQKMYYFCAPKNDALYIFENNFQFLCGAIKHVFQEANIQTQTENIFLQSLTSLKNMWIERTFGYYTEQYYCLLNLTLLADKLDLENIGDLLSHNQNEKSIRNTFHCILDAEEITLLTGNFLHKTSDQEPRTQEWISFYQQTIESIPSSELKTIDKYLQHYFKDKKNYFSRAIFLIILVSLFALGLYIMNFLPLI